jgi:hypothetical protein
MLGIFLFIKSGLNMNSYVRNSIVINREATHDQPLFFEAKNGEILARLDGFIIPKERVPNLEAFLLTLRIDSDPSTSLV